MDAQIVVRTCGERSLPLCLQAIESQGNPIVIEEAPFIKAVTKTFEIGKDSAANWLIAVDADVILNPNALSTMLEGANEMLKKAPNLFLIDFPLIDKFRGTCLGGCHVYNNAYSKQVYEFFKDIPYDPQEARPEKTNTLKFTEKLGLLNTSYHEAVGLHDYEQYYGHIYVKYYRRAVKQAAFIPEIIERILQRRMEYVEDLDFVVALFGLYAGEGKTEIMTDARFYPKIEEVMGVQEKAPISLG